ncbi:unnamed protein product [Phytomonas sp. EM1]|nr:unnamed protein product [Phytomonas sp. EM1]|eukprot:CCW65048.1 unnamed protein product [Phytomonas sp. isolate EM1]
MIQRQTSDFTGSNSHLSVLFGPITVVAVYPTFAILCWEAPQSVKGSFPFGNIQWNYTTEWNGSHAHAADPLHLSSDASHIAIPLVYPGETVYVRVIAKGHLKNGTVALGSAKMSFLATCTTPMPWLRPGALDSPLLFDALYMCAIDCIPAIFSQYRSDIDRIDDKGYCILDTAAHCHKLHVLYKKPQSPARSSSIYYLVVTSSVKNEGRRKRLSTSSLLETLRAEQAAVFFCGVSELGAIAAMNAYSVFAFLAQHTESGLMEDLQSCVFCIAYGTARRCFTHELPLLRNAAYLSGNVLFYSGLPRRCDAASGLSDVMSTAGATSLLTREQEGEPRGVPLGVRTVPLLNPQTGCSKLLLEISSIDPVTDEEHLECLNIAHHLNLLCELVLPHSSRGLLAPYIHSVRYRVIDIATLLLDIQGQNLQFNPFVTGVCCSSGFPLVMTTRSFSSDIITVSISLMQMVVQPGLLCGSCVDLSSGSHLLVQLLVQTDLGIVETETPVPISIPSGMIELMRHACDTKSDFSAWLTGLPSVFVDASVNWLPFIVGSGTRVVHAGSASSQGDRIKQKLSSLSSVAELSFHYACHQQQTEGGFLAFVSAVASRFMRKPDPEVAGLLILSSPPQLKEAIFLSQVLGAYNEGKATRLTEFLSHMSSWKMRIFRGLPHLSDATYEMILQRLLLLFQEVDAAHELSLVGMELLLYASVLQHLRSSDSNIGSVEGHLYPWITDTLSFEKFYELLCPLFLPYCSLSGDIEAKMVREVSQLWSICLLLELRCVQALIHVAAVTGCHGSGRSTIINTLFSTLLDSRVVRSNKEVVLRQIDGDELELMQQVLGLGMSTTVFIVGELSDFSGTEFSSIVHTVQSSVKDYGRQKVQLVVSKVDEHLQHYGAIMQSELLSLNNCKEAEIFEAARHALDAMASALPAHIQESVLALSLLPSPLCIRSLFHRLGGREVQGEDLFASALVHFSRQALLHAITEGLQLDTSL